MEAVDNFEKLESYFQAIENNSDAFYFVQLLVRKHTNEAMLTTHNNRERTIKHYCIDSLAKLNRYKKEIVYLCDTTGARAYINLNARGYKRSALANINLLSDALSQGHESTCISTYSKAIMDSPIIGEKVWVIDIDQKDFINGQKMHECMAQIGFSIPLDCTIKVVPSKDGMHILTPPFRRDTFIKKMEEQGFVEGQHYELKRDSSTNLYIPKQQTIQDSN